MRPAGVVARIRGVQELAVAMTLVVDVTMGLVDAMMREDAGVMMRAVAVTTEVAVAMILPLQGARPPQPLQGLLLIQRYVACILLIAPVDLNLARPRPV